MGEHDYYFAHGEYVYNHQLHVPLIVRYGREFAGIRNDYVQHVDILPTILNVVHAEIDSRMRGADLRKKSGPRDIFAEMSTPHVPDAVKYSIISEDMKLIYTPDTRIAELYDLRSDPGERNDLSGQQEYRQMGSRLLSRLEEYAYDDLLQVDTSAYREPVTEQEKAKLRSLGYLE